MSSEDFVKASAQREGQKIAVGVHLKNNRRRLQLAAASPLGSCHTVGGSCATRLEWDRRELSAARHRGLRAVWACALLLPRLQLPQQLPSLGRPPGTAGAPRGPSFAP